MAYIHIESGRYPLSEQEIRRENPNTSYTATFSAEGYEWIFPAPQPTYNQYTQRVKEITPVLTDKGHYEQQWAVEDIILTEEETAYSISQLKQQKLTQLANLRYQKEVSGIAVGGTTIKTDRESQATLTGAWVAVQQNPARLIDWKADSGWTQIDKTTVEALSSAVAYHVQACFSRERVLSTEIEAINTIQGLQVYEIVWEE